MRVTTASTYRRVLAGLRLNQNTSLRAQEQLSTGKRIVRPSDDPTGASRAVRLERQLADVGRFREAVGEGTRLLQTAESSMLETSSLLSEARELLLQGMNGTVSSGDRRSIGIEMGMIREQLIDLANQRSGEQYVFGGTAVDGEPFEEVFENGRARVVYRGNEDEVVARIGLEYTTAVTMAGSELFGRFDPTGTSYGGLTGAAKGTTVDEGQGYAFPEFRHDSTSAGTLASVGLALVAGGTQDTILGSNTLTIDATAGTIQLGTGEAVALPATTETDFVVTNELGGELHLDFSGFTGLDYSGTVDAAGSVSLDGIDFVSMDFTETNLEVIDEGGGRTLHIDTTGVKRAGSEQVTFAGTTNVFDLLGAIADDLRNDDGLETDVVLERLGNHLGDFDRHHDNILDGTGVLGARSARLQTTESRVLDLEVQLQGMLSEIADVDFAEAAATLNQSEYLLQIAQASGARVLQSSLLNFLG